MLDTLILSPEDLQNEKNRVLDVARALRRGAQGEIKLIARLSFKQCWEIIHHLRANGFVVKPDGNKVNGITKFSIDDEGALSLWFRHKFTSIVEKKFITEKQDAHDSERPSRQRSRRSKGVSKGALNSENKRNVIDILNQLNIPQTPFSALAAPSPVPRKFMPGKAKPPRLQP